MLKLYMKLYYTYFELSNTIKIDFTYLILLKNFK
jgi:hypothetical protein